MPKYESKSIRNVAIIGHGGTGKTTLCESLLYVAGKTDRPGRVDEGTSSMDYEPEEQKRHISIGAATNNIEWDKHRINMIDTPGDSNFAFDTKSCLRIVDGVVVLVDAVGGVEFQTEKVWEYADEFKLPRLIFISRMDRERADFAESGGKHPDPPRKEGHDLFSSHRHRRRFYRSGRPDRDEGSCLSTARRDWQKQSISPPIWPRM